VTVIKILPGDIIDAEYLRSRIHQYINDCDVFRLDFLHCIQFSGALREQVDLKQDAEAQLQEWGNSWIKFAPTKTTHDGPPTGPYVALHEQMHQVWRVYDDDARAFLVSTWPTEEDVK